jgi:hypothetical protein
MQLITVILVISIAATLPQIYQTLTTGSTGDLNRVNLILNLITNVLLAAYGYQKHDWGIFTLGAWFTGYWSFLLLINIRPK